MHFQIPFIFVRFPTDLTEVWLIVRVSLQMHLKFAVKGEHPSTDFANRTVNICTMKQPIVRAKTGIGLERSSTLKTQVFVLVAMNMHHVTFHFCLTKAVQ